MIVYKSSDPILKGCENTTMGIDLLRAEQVTEDVLIFGVLLANKI